MTSKVRTIVDWMSRSPLGFFYILVRRCSIRFALGLVCKMSIYIDAP